MLRNNLIFILFSASEKSFIVTFGILYWVSSGSYIFLHKFIVACVMCVAPCNVCITLLVSSTILILIDLFILFDNSALYTSILSASVKLSTTKSKLLNTLFEFLILLSKRPNESPFSIFGELYSKHVIEGELIIDAMY